VDEQSIRSTRAPNSSRGFYLDGNDWLNSSEGMYKKIDSLIVWQWTPWLDLAVSLKDH
jgi:hypothetical protein